MEKRSMPKPPCNCGLLKLMSNNTQQSRAEHVLFSSSLSLKFALRESGCRIGYEAAKMTRYHFWWSISRDTNVDISALEHVLIQY